MHRHVLLILAAVAVAFTGCDSVQSEGPTSALAPQTLAASSSGPAGGDAQINQLTAACQGWWRINNDARDAQTYTWRHLQSGQTGSVSVAAGDRAFFRTDALTGEVLLFVDGDRVSTKSSSPAPCGSLSGRVNAVPDGSEDPSVGSGLKDVLVQVFFDGADPATDAPIYETRTDEDGAYTFTGLPTYTSPLVPRVDYLVVVPEAYEGAFNEDLYAFFDPIETGPLAVPLPNASVDDADIGFDGDDAALTSEVEAQNASGERAPWSVRELRQAFDRARKGKDQGNAVLSRDDLLDIVKEIVDDPYDASDDFFGLSSPYLGPVRRSGDTPYTDQELLDWGYEVLKDVPRQPQDPAALLYKLTFACQVNYFGGQGLNDAALDEALLRYLEADVAATPSSRRAGESLSTASFGTTSSAQRIGGGGGGTVELASAYLGGGGGGTVED